MCAMLKRAEQMELLYSTYGRVKWYIHFVKQSFLKLTL